MTEAILMTSSIPVSKVYIAARLNLSKSYSTQVPKRCRLQSASRSQTGSKRQNDRSGVWTKRNRKKAQIADDALETLAPSSKSAVRSKTSTSQTAENKRFGCLGTKSPTLGKIHPYSQPLRKSLWKGRQKMVAETPGESAKGE